MGPMLSLLRYCLHFVLAGLLMQLSAMPPDSGEQNPFARQTSPPAQFLKFADDFSSLDKAVSWTGSTEIAAS